MLRVREAQILALADASRVRFEKELAEQLGAPPDDVASAVSAAKARGFAQARDVVEFVEESAGLEQLFMTLTEGIVQ